jgi:ankyrin repeat protein
MKGEKKMEKKITVELIVVFVVGMLLVAAAVLYESTQMQGSKAQEIIAGGDVNAINDYGITALHYAAGTGDIELVQELIRLGADVNARDRDGMTPLHYAMLMRQIDTANVLFRLGADINAKNNAGQKAVRGSRVLPLKH